MMIVDINVDLQGRRAADESTRLRRGCGLF